MTKAGRLGPAESDEKVRIILNRVTRWGEAGVEYEADPRQVERLLEETGLEGDIKSVAAQCIKQLAAQIAEDKELPASECIAYRDRAARANYLSGDRPAVQFAAKESCRWMSKPSENI